METLTVEEWVKSLCCLNSIERHIFWFIKKYHILNIFVPWS